MREQDLVHYSPLTELLLYSAASYMLVTQYWLLLDDTASFRVIMLLGAVLGVRLVCAVGVHFASDNGASVQTTHRIAFYGNLLAGIGWGVLPTMLYLLGIDEVAHDLLFALVNASLAMLAFIASGVMASAYLAFAAPAFGIPLLLSLHTGEPVTGGVWGLLLLISLIMAGATRRIYTVMGRYRKESMGNRELYQKLMSSRDEALQAKQKLEQVNVALKEEVRERELAEERIAASEHELNRILEEMIDTYFRVDNEGKLTRISPSVREMLGREPNTLLDESFSLLFSNASELGRLHQSLEEQYGIATNVEVRLLNALGEEIWAALNVRTFMDASGQIAGFEGVARDVTENKIAAEALFQEKERLHVTLESIGDAVITTNTAYEVEYINPAAETITGWRCDEARGRRLDEVLRLLDEKSAQPFSLPLDIWVGHGRRAALPEPVILCDREGNGKSAIELNGAPIRDSANRVVGAVLVFHDVTKLRSLARELAYQATHDPLTGLINRMEFDRQVTTALQSAQEDGLSHALCYIDLDRFKQVNDTSGHHAGDELLKQITDLMASQLRQSDLLARLGGDEFGVLLTGCGLEQAAKIAEKIRAAVESFRFIWGDKQFSVGTSIGVVAISRESESLTELLSAADSACYVAKESGRNRVHIYTPDDEEEAERRGKVQWLQRIRGALEGDQFELHFQPIATIDEAGREGRHGEVLLRMVDDSGTGARLIQPNSFLSAAERYHLMPQIDQWVIRHTFKALAENNAETADIGSCSINLSGQSLGEGQLHDYILQQQEQSGVASQMICFELTESAVMANIEQARNFIVGLHEKGFRFALENFSAGFSTFDYLKELPIDYLKLNGALTRDIATNRVSLAKVRAINYIAHVVGVKVIAELVEDEATVEALRSVSVNYAQGYWLGRPSLFSKAQHLPDEESPLH